MLSLHSFSFQSASSSSHNKTEMKCFLFKCNRFLNLLDILCEFIWSKRRQRRLETLAKYSRIYGEDCRNLRHQKEKNML